MGITVEFYSINLQKFELVLQSKNENVIFETIEKAPIVDFSFHIVIPDDLNNLCYLFAEQIPSFHPIFRDFLVKQLWDGGPSESLALLSHNFPLLIARSDTKIVEKVAQSWAETFPYQESVEQTHAYQAVMQLCNLAKSTIKENEQIILYLLGENLFYS